MVKRGVSLERFKKISRASHHVIKHMDIIQHRYLKSSDNFINESLNNFIFLGKHSLTDENPLTKQNNVFYNRKHMSRKILTLKPVKTL